MNFLDFYKRVIEKRNFNTKKYIEDKTKAINDFFREEGLDSVVLGISGGIDSALVVNLFAEASKQKDSPIKKIMGLILPINGEGTTGQEKAKLKAIEVMERIKSDVVTYDVFDLSPAYREIVSQGGGQAWAQGQMASVLRTPALYYYAALLQEEGFRSIVSGTTNRDEGAYIGFYGKGSDGMVDIQPIGDLHKTEVVLVSKALNVPVEIQIAKPAGDVFDGRHDEQMIGSPYWFLESYLIMMEHNCLSYMLDLEKPEQEKARQWAQNIEKLHKINSHKYKVGLPARFIDVLPRTIPGGWQ